jgi:hypothetical protein
MEKYLFGRIVEVKREELRRRNVETLLKKFPQFLVDTLTDGHKSEIAELVRLEKVEGRYRVVVVEEEAKRRKGVRMLKHLIDRSWQSRDFAQVAKLSQVALVLDPADVEILCFLGQAMWELDDPAGCELVEEAARRDPKFRTISERVHGEQIAREKFALCMAPGIFAEENFKQARKVKWMSHNDSVCGKLSVFFMISGVVLYLVAVFSAVLIS